MAYTGSQQLSGIGGGLSGLASSFDTPGSSSSDAGTIELIAGLFGQGGEGAEIARFLKGKGEDRFNKTLDPFTIPESTPGFNFNDFLSKSAIGQELNQELLNPTFGASNPEQQSYLNSIQDSVQGNAAIRGLDPTMLSIMKTLAPELQKMRQERVGNLQTSFSSELQSALGGAQLGTQERAGDISALLGARGQTIEGEQGIFDEGSNLLLALADLSRPTPVVKQGASRSDAGGPSTTSKVLSGLGTAATVAAMFSDRRLKRNIVKIKEFVKGINLYIYEYLWSSTKHIGFMADEVKLILPQAVVRDESGFDKVYYGEVLNYGNKR